MGGPEQSRHREGAEHTASDCDVSYAPNPSKHGSYSTRRPDGPRARRTKNRAVLHVKRCTRGIPRSPGTTDLRRKASAASVTESAGIGDSCLAGARGSCGVTANMTCERHGSPGGSPPGASAQSVTDPHRPASMHFVSRDDVWAPERGARHVPRETNGRTASLQHLVTRTRPKLRTPVGCSTVSDVR